MPNVVRFTLSTAREQYVPGLGRFDAGVFDVDANDLEHLVRARFLLQPYGVTEVGVVDSAAPYPSLPAAPGPMGPDPYPQYATVEEIVASDAVKAALALPFAGPIPASLVTQGLYQRTTPAPTGSTAGLVALAKDPSVAGRVWVLGRDFGQLGFTDTDGATWTSKAVPPAAPVGLYFTASYAWLLCGPIASQQGSLYRSPLPDSSGNGLAWTKMFDLAAPPGGMTTAVGATFRNSCVAFSGTNVYLLEYGVGALVTGGPSVYVSTDSGATWAKPKTWANAKHGHAVKVIGGVPWVMLGDGGTAFTDLGLWNATSTAGTTWNQRSLYSHAAGGNTLYGINFFPANVGGQPMILAEYDGNYNHGPIVFPSQATNVTRALLPTFTMPHAYAGTMRQMTLTSEGNLMWVHTGEGGAVSATDSIVIAKGPHFTQPVVLETIANTGNPLGTLGDPIENGQYIWFGHHRVRKEKFLGQ